MEGKPRLLDQVREQIRLKHYSIRTERVYWSGLSVTSVFTNTGTRLIWVRQR